MGRMLFRVKGYLLGSVLSDFTCETLSRWTHVVLWRPLVDRIVNLTLLEKLASVEMKTAAVCLLPVGPVFVLRAPVVPAFPVPAPHHGPVPSRALGLCFVFTPRPPAK